MVTGVTGGAISTLGGPRTASETLVTTAGKTGSEEFDRAPVTVIVL